MKLLEILGLTDFRSLGEILFPKLRRTGWGQFPLMTEHPNTEIYRLPKQQNGTLTLQVLQAESLENFNKLVREENTPKLIEYFRRFGINTKTIKNNLKILIEEELRDLQRGKTEDSGHG